MKKKKDEVTIRSSAAEYLTYVASVGDQQDSIEMRYEDENIWLTQKMMATLYDVGINTINYHIKKIFEDSELQEDSVIRKIRITAFDRKSYNTNHYSLEMIIAVGFKVNSERADADKPHMGLSTWAAAPDGKIVKSDVSIAKNYLSEEEMHSLERIVSAYLDLAEDRAERHIPMTMEDWSKRLDLFLMADDREVLQDAGKITAEIAKAKAETEFEKYRVVQDRLFMSDFDKYMLELEENAKK
ncbi:toxin-antitoxin system toxin component Fic family [Firmicutes bacterium CAG:882]|nr:toxin-antitoxin system toxin component Fic family [Firmicutes bacterium CAG:882]